MTKDDKDFVCNFLSTEWKENSIIPKEIEILNKVAIERNYEFRLTSENTRLHKMSNYFRLPIRQLKL